MSMCSDVLVMAHIVQHSHALVDSAAIVVTIRRDDYRPMAKLTICSRVRDILQYYKSSNQAHQASDVYDLKTLKRSSSGLKVFSPAGATGLPKGICAISCQEVGRFHSERTRAVIRGL